MSVDSPRDRGTEEPAVVNAEGDGGSPRRIGLVVAVSAAVAVVLLGGAALAVRLLVFAVSSSRCRPSLTTSTWL